MDRYLRSVGDGSNVFLRSTSVSNESVSRYLVSNRNGNDVYLKTSTYIPPTSTSIYLRNTLNGNNRYLRSNLQTTLPPVPLVTFGSGMLLYSKDGQYFRIN